MRYELDLRLYFESVIHRQGFVAGPSCGTVRAGHLSIRAARPCPDEQSLCIKPPF